MFDLNHQKPGLDLLVAFHDARTGEMVPRTRIERATFALGVRCSILLSYRGNDAHFSL